MNNKIEYLVPQYQENKLKMQVIVDNSLVEVWKFFQGNRFSI